MAALLAASDMLIVSAVVETFATANQQIPGGGAFHLFLNSGRVVKHVDCGTGGYDVFIHQLTGALAVVDGHGDHLDILVNALAGLAEPLERECGGFLVNGTGKDCFGEAADFAEFYFDDAHVIPL